VSTQSAPRRSDTNAAAPREGSSDRDQAGRAQFVFHRRGRSQITAELCCNRAAVPCSARAPPQEHAPATAGVCAAMAAALTLVAAGNNFAGKLTAHPSIDENSPETPSEGKVVKKSAPAALSASAPAVPARGPGDPATASPPRTGGGAIGLQFLQRRPAVLRISDLFRPSPAGRHPADRTKDQRSIVPARVRLIKKARAESERVAHGSWFLEGSARNSAGGASNLSPTMGSRSSPAMRPRST